MQSLRIVLAARNNNHLSTMGISLERKADKVLMVDPSRNILISVLSEEE
jgi:hypothetical protein